MPRVPYGVINCGIITLGTAPSGSTLWWPCVTIVDEMDLCATKACTRAGLARKPPVLVAGPAKRPSHKHCCTLAAAADSLSAWTKRETMINDTDKLNAAVDAKHLHGKGVEPRDNEITRDA